MTTFTTTSAAAVMEKAKAEFLAEGSIDSVTAFDLVMEGIDPDKFIDDLEAAIHAAA
ncbi:hypothetical protein [Phyllobacterium endophyticum]|uniref:hypothetical protein n=1 Tax=Phyllobacterium endophyticum TaxID=1149773 RepID=UPI00164F8487|nr:hypothetical protein [Phyllobacterium endophyticum]